jgi:beta-fructofuranosidase
VRPAVHLTAPTGWLNDPHGITWRDGTYHVFHQAVPDGLLHRPGISWAHAVSPDLLSFEHRPAALVPDGQDDGIWTGCLVTDPTTGRTRILFTSVRESALALGRVRVAQPADSAWDVWRKGPVVVEPPGGLELAVFRDPFVLREDDGWRMLVGAGMADGTAAALTWTSDDLAEWRFDGVAAARHSREREPVWTGSAWECPQLVEVDGRQVLVVSVWEDDLLHHAAYGLGTFGAGRFRDADWDRLTWGTHYAPSCFRDAEGRPCLLSWVRGVGDAEAGWASCLSVPQVLEVRGGRVRLEPHPVLAAARGPEVDPARLPGGAVDLEWRPGRSGVPLSLAGPGGTTTLRVGEQGVGVDSPAGSWTVPGGPQPEVRLLLDGPVLELWVDGRPLAAPVPPVRRVGGTGVTGWEVRPGSGTS